MNSDAFTLDTSWSKTPKRNPSKEDVLQAVERMQEEDYVTLSLADDDFIQAAAGVLEYGQNGRLFRCELAIGERNAIQRAMISYLQNEDFRACLEWKDVTQELVRGRKQSRVIIIAAFIAAMLFVLWMTLRD